MDSNNATHRLCWMRHVAPDRRIWLSAASGGKSLRILSGGGASLITALVFLDSIAHRDQSVLALTFNFLPFAWYLTIACLESVLQVMLVTRLATDAFGILTISLVFLAAVLGLVCIFHSLYFKFCIKRRCYPQLNYFNGPWISRIFLILVSIWWGFGEIIRLSYLKPKIFSNQAWQKNICKFYVLSNLGFAEPSMFLLLSFLLHSALQKREFGTLSPRWNRKTLFYVLLCCFPILSMHFALVSFGPKYSNQVNSAKKRNISRFFRYVDSSSDGDTICMYPLLSTTILAVLYVLLSCYIIWICTRLLNLVINKGLRRRIYVLVMPVIFLPLRVALIALSVLPPPGNALYEGIVFLAFLVLLSSIAVGIFMLVYFPVADSLALRNVGHVEIEGIPYDDFYYDGASLMANQSHQGVFRNSDESLVRHSTPFQSLSLEGFPASEATKADFRMGL
ncbi:hypothetical protein ZIOFF_050196 [Zingiber officinale]|uniref:Uncharacterized protein n=2 Tax=Zingiber officinale TaxID=94328 RepID=A0A8J5FJW1_ZINOF|nr:hypothetical protein ZIOFF_050196 [Zingiber officinale]